MTTNNNICFTSGDKWLNSDHRFHNWAYKFTGAGVDINNLFVRGTAGEFVKFSAEVALGDDDFLIVASQTGSRAHHYYDYVFVALGGGGEAVDIFQRAEFGKLFRRLAKAGKLTASQYTQAMGSDTSRMLAWAWAWANGLSNFGETPAKNAPAESAPAAVAEDFADYIVRRAA